MESEAVGSPDHMPTMASRRQTLTVALSPEPESARRARRALVDGGLDPDLDHTVSLLTSEIVTNSVRHSDTPDDILLDAVLEEGYARVVVVDRGPGFDPEIRHKVNGFGLRLVDKLASRWGVDRHDAETRVWFEVDRRRRRFDRAR
jgi:anti-sigma regulatory factor (Ser/Thr protein kinase)